MELSTFGGWVATNASGMKRNRYGNIEDIVEERNLGDTVRRCREPVRHAAPVRRRAGVQGGVRQRGNLGLVTKAVLRIHRLPEAKRYGSMIFTDWGTGVAFMAALNQTGAKPASIGWSTTSSSAGARRSSRRRPTEGRCSPASWRSSSSPG